MLKKSAAALFVISGVSVGAAPAYAIPDVALEQYAFVIDGVLSHYTTAGGTLGGAPAGVDLSGFAPGSVASQDTGLGIIEISVSGPGPHYVGLFVDHEFSELANTFFNEEGADSGGPLGAGQSWEIDDPDVGPTCDPGGSGFNCILGDLSVSSLLNTNFIAGMVTDVSMAMACDFTLGVDESAVISFTISDVSPTGGFFLRHNDEATEEAIFLSGHVSITSVPEPGTLALFGAGLLAFGGLRRSLRGA